MRLAFCCQYSPTLCWARRCLEEGSEVLVYFKGDRTNKSGEGIVPITKNQNEWLAWGARDPNTIYFFDITKAGDLADTLIKQGRKVINGGSFQDRLELDREWGENLAKKVGIQTPPTYTFSTISEVENFLQTNPAQQYGDGGWAWKASRDLGCDTTLVGKDAARVIDHVGQIRRRFSDNVKCILQEKIDGVAVSSAQWWNGIDWVGPFQGTIENKKFMNDGLGPATGCSFNVVWFYWDKNPRIRQELKFNELAVEFRRLKAPPGLYDINAILNKKGAWFLEWTPRLGIDSEITSQRSIISLSQFIESLSISGNVDHMFDVDSCYFDIALSVPPYPVQEWYKNEKSPAVGVPVRGIDGLTSKNFVMGGLYRDSEAGFCVGEPTGNLGYVVHKGHSLKTAYDKMYKWIKDTLVIPDLQYRTDCHRILQEDINKMMSYGYELTPALKE